MLGKSKNKYKTLISLFVCLYVMVAGISFFHAIDFFNVGNNYWMSVILAFAFEVAQAAVLFAILTTNHKKSWLAWTMLILLVTVQCSANVYSVYKYMSLSGEQFYQYIKDSLLFWMYTIDEKEVKVTVSWVIGALLPLIALGMTAMVADTMNYVEDDQKSQTNTNDKDNDDQVDSQVHESNVEKATVKSSKEESTEENRQRNEEKESEESRKNSEQTSTKVSESTSEDSETEEQGRKESVAEIKGEEKPLRKNLDVIVAHEGDGNHSDKRRVNYHTTI